MIWKLFYCGSHRGPRSLVVVIDRLDGLWTPNCPIKNKSSCYFFLWGPVPTKMQQTPIIFHLLMQIVTFYLPKIFSACSPNNSTHLKRLLRCAAWLCLQPSIFIIHNKLLTIGVSDKENQNQSINQPINQSINQSINEIINKPII